MVRVTRVRVRFRVRIRISQGRGELESGSGLGLGLRLELCLGLGLGTKNRSTSYNCKNKWLPRKLKRGVEWNGLEVRMIEEQWWEEKECEKEKHHPTRTCGLQ